MKEKIKELKKTTKGKAILRLIKWCIYFFALFIFLAIAALATPKNNSISKPNANPDIKEPVTEDQPITPEETLSLETLNNTYNSLIKYDYNYEIAVNDSKYIFKGSKDSTIDTGYKESPDGTIKYIIDNTGTYNETTSGKTLITDLYEGLNAEYFNLTNIFNTLKTIELKINRNHNCTNYLYEGKLEDITYQIELKENTKELMFIYIISENTSYQLNFSNINK